MLPLAQRHRVPARILVAVAATLLALCALPRTASALKKPVCSTITCSGGGEPNFTIDVGGATHPEIVPIFWGFYWNSAPALRAQMVGAIQAMVNGAYFGDLNQYGAPAKATIGPARMAPMAPIYTGVAVASPLTTTNVALVVDAMIESNEVPGPAPDAVMIYVVIVPPGDVVGGWNAYANCSPDFCGPQYPYPSSYVYALVGGGDTKTLSHELVEAMTQNTFNSNCVYTSTGDSANQIADVCSCYSETEMASTGNPIQLAAYWSAKQDSCVIPEGWNGVQMYNWYDWTDVYSGTVRQVVAGEFGVVATDTNDNLIGISGLSGTLGGPGAMFAVGNSAILALAPDAGAVWKFEGGSWTQIGGPSTSVLAGGYEVATDFTGQPFVFSSSTWTNVGGPADQFAVNHAGISAISIDHQSVWLDANGTSGGWTQIGGSALELFVGRDNGIAEMLEDSSRSVAYYSGSGTTWNAQGGNGYSFTVTLDDFFFGLNTDRSGIYESSDTGAVNPAWLQVGDSAGRLVAKTDSGGGLYATGGLVY